MKKVMCNGYGEEATDVQEMKNMQYDAWFRDSKKFHGARNTNRAYDFASSSVKENLKSVTGLPRDQNLWKMRQFSAVKSRVGKHHENTRARSATIRKWN